MTTITLAPAPAPSIPRITWLALVVLLAGVFMALLDTTIINVALPTIRTSIGASNATLSWIISGYALAFGLALIPAGRVGDRFGHNWVFITGLALFTLASVACGLAQDGTQHIVARVVQGLAGGTFGGLIIKAFGTDRGWRLVFGVNFPIGVLAIIAAFLLLAAGAENKSTGVDWFGLLLLSAGLAALLVLFVHRSFTGGTILAVVYFAAFTSIFFTLSLFWQAGLGHSALESGLILLPFAIGSIAGASQSDRLAARFGRTVLVFGLALVTAGLVAVCLLLAIIAPTTLTNWHLLVPLLVAGVGSGLFIAPNMDFIVATVDRREAGAASGVIGTMQRIGSAIGIAIIGSVLFGTLDFGTGGPDAAAIAFGRSATIAMAVSSALSVVAFALVFALPKRPGSSKPHLK